jgi:hemerythrin-like domain-containing protein
MLRDSSLIPLSHQHHNGLALCVLTRRSLTSDSSAENIARQAKRIIERFEVELINHFQVEEQVLFPACGRLPIIEDLLRQHRALATLVERMRTAPSSELIEEFCDLLSLHIRREEKEFFEDVQKTLPREVLDRLGREIDRQTVRVCLKVE